MHRANIYFLWLSPSQLGEEVWGAGRVGWSKSVLAGLNNNTQKLNIAKI